MIYFFLSILHSAILTMMAGVGVDLVPTIVAAILER